jgi:hypothetical protein
MIVPLQIQTRCAGRGQRFYVSSLIRAVTRRIPDNAISTHEMRTIGKRNEVDDVHRLASCELRTMKNIPRVSRRAFVLEALRLFHTTLVWCRRDATEVALRGRERIPCAP